MERILIVSNNQFGYLIDTLKYCEYLGEKYEIHIVCVDNGLDKIISKNINVHYIKNTNKYYKRIEFINVVKKITINFKPDIIFIDYFFGCSLIKLIVGNKFIYNVDIRTGAINKRKIIRKICNLFIKLECSMFSNISIISNGLLNYLNIRKKGVHVLPLGADRNLSKDITHVIKNSNSSNINLIYTGTLFERNIEQTIVGVKMFLDSNCSNNTNIRYDIIGFSKNIDDEISIKDYINNLGLKEVVKYHGRLDHAKSIEAIKASNIGVSYVPINEYFDFQPPTKTFEYLLSGIPCIATRTFENRKIINKSNGILVDDNAVDFCEGLIKIINNINNYNAEEIVNSVIEYTWENIVFSNLEPYLKKLSNN